MREIDVWAAGQNLDNLVDDVQTSDGVITITKDGVPAAVLLSIDEFESIQETIFWLSLVEWFPEGVERSRAASRVLHHPPVPQPV